MLWNNIQTYKIFFRSNFLILNKNYNYYNSVGWQKKMKFTNILLNNGKEGGNASDGNGGGGSSGMSGGREM